MTNQKKYKKEIEFLNLGYLQEVSVNNIFIKNNTKQINPCTEEITLRC